MAVRLCNENLAEVSSHFFAVPAYDRSAVTSGFLHIGPSAFFRSHLALAADELLAKQQKAGLPLTWGITAVSMKSSDVRDDIASQDYLYTLTSKGKGPEQGRIVGSIRDIMVAKENPRAVLEAAADPAIKVISLTVTQKGYYYDKEKGFDFDHPDIKADLAAADNEAMSSIGLIVSALDLRRQRNIAPPTILSCDNLPGNGTMLRGAVLAYAERKSPELHKWISDHVEFPVTMVDRITPSKSETHIAFVADKGVQDNRPVEAEPMPNMPFVIERKVSRDPVTGEAVEFPDLESVGAVMGHGVAPYELLKLRSLNGAHMALGCIGHVMGYSYSHQAIHDPLIRQFITGFMAEVGQTLKPTDGVDQNEYRRGLMDRLDNDKICDPLTRLARNGSQDKVQGRLVDPLRDCLADAERSHGHLTFALASWIEYLKCMDKNGCLPGSTEPNDKKAADIGLLELVREDLTDPSPLFAVEALRFNGIGKNQTVIDEVRGHLEAIQEHGIEQALANFIATRPDIPGLLHEAVNDDEPEVDQTPDLGSGAPKLQRN